jgi:hypothetical protein
MASNGKRHWEDAAGSTFVKKLDQIILQIGVNKYTRRELAEQAHCYNFAAAMRLNRAINEQFDSPGGVRSLARRMTPEELCEIKGVGVTTVVVWLSVLDYEGVGWEQWLDRKTKIQSIIDASRKVPNPNKK